MWTFRTMYSHYRQVHVSASTSHAKISPVFKSHSLPPLTIVPYLFFLLCMSKVLEGHKLNYFPNFGSVNQILSDSQYSFRPGRSTESALLSVTHSWLSSLDAHNSLSSSTYVKLSILYLIKLLCTLFSPSVFLPTSLPGSTATFVITLNK